MSGLSCGCAEFDPEPGVVYWYPPNGEGYVELDTKRGRRCCSCSRLVRPGELVVPFGRAMVPDHDVEVSIYGEDGEVPRATAYLCERCGDIYWSLAELGYCVPVWDTPMDECLEQYREIVAGEFEPEGFG